MSVRNTDVLVDVGSGIGRLTLHRPQAFNALTHDMVLTQSAWLERWRTDDHVRVVVIEGSGEDALSVGTDIVQLREDVHLGGQRSARRRAAEYRLAAQVAAFPKPVVAMMDGIVMGSGLGIAAHASHRVVTEDSVLAVAEVAVGLLPAAGATYWLARAPGELGTHLTLTADRLDSADALYCGLADSWVPRARRAALLAALATTDVDDALRAVSVSPPCDSALQGDRSWIDDCYATDRVEDIVRRLHSHGSAAAAAAAERILEVSPTAAQLALRALRAARADALMESSLRREYPVAIRALEGHDAIEGLRAQALDVKHVPTWDPASLASVDSATVDAYFAAITPHELDLEHLRGC